MGIAAQQGCLVLQGTTDGRLDSVLGRHGCTRPVQLVAQPLSLLLEFTQSSPHDVGCLITVGGQIDEALLAGLDPGSANRDTDHRQILEDAFLEQLVEPDFVLSLGKWGRRPAAKRRSSIRSGRMRAKRVSSAASRPMV